MGRTATGRYGPLFKAPGCPAAGLWGLGAGRRALELVAGLLVAFGAGCWSLGSGGWVVQVLVAGALMLVDGFWVPCPSLVMRRCSISWVRVAG